MYWHFAIQYFPVFLHIENNLIVLLSPRLIWTNFTPLSYVPLILHSTWGTAYCYAQLVFIMRPCSGPYNHVYQGAMLQHLSIRRLLPDTILSNSARIQPSLSHCIWEHSLRRKREPLIHSGVFDSYVVSA